MADAFTSLTATLALGAEKDMTIPVHSSWVVLPNDEDSEEEINAICALETVEEDWCQPIVEYLEHENFQVTQGIKQKYDRELRVFCIITKCSIDALFIAFGYNTWI